MARLAEALAYYLRRDSPYRNVRFGSAASQTGESVAAGLYARVSTNHRQTLAMQNRAMRDYAVWRGSTIALQVREVNSGAVRRSPQKNTGS